MKKPLEEYDSKLDRHFLNKLIERRFLSEIFDVEILNFEPLYSRQHHEDWGVTYIDKIALFYSGIITLKNHSGKTVQIQAHDLVKFFNNDTNKMIEEIGIKICLKDIKSLKKLEVILDRYNNMIGVNSLGENETDEYDILAEKFHNKVLDIIKSGDDLSERIEAQHE